jgi:4-hydroxybenzoate polyprenyltransferase
MGDAPTSTVAGTVTGLLREIRPHQWYKQGILLLGIVFSQSVTDAAAWTQVLAAVAAFTAVAGATYVFNDISDVEEDRRHPEKRNRPIASGQVSIPLAAGFAVALLVGGIATAYLVTPLLLGILLAYLAQNALYSLFLKEIALVDVMVVAIGFVLRAVAGVVAIGVFLSPWLIVCTFLLALVLALGKRRHELAAAANPAETRAVLDSYTEETLDQLLIVVTATLLVAYALYTFFRADTAMMLTLPFAFFGVFRYHLLVNTTDIAGRPEYLLTDRPSVVNLACWGVIAVGVLYDVPVRLLEALP